VLVVMLTTSEKELPVDEQSRQISHLTAEVGRLTQAIRLSLEDFTKQNGGVALSRLRDAIAPRPFVHILRFPATAKQLQTRCGVRTFSENDVLVGSEEQVPAVIADDKLQPCDACMKGYQSK
jgi:hypothetical protein